MRPRVALRPAFRRQHPRARNATDHPPPTGRGHHHTGAIWDGSPTAALNRHRAVTISDQARPATAPSGLTSHRCFAPPPDRPPSVTGPAPPLTHLGHHWAVLRTVTTALTRPRRVNASIPPDQIAALVQRLVRACPEIIWAP